MARYEPLDRLVADFSEGRQGVTALTFLGIASLVYKGREEFGLSDVYNAVKDILSKLRSRPSVLDKEVTVMSISSPLGRLSDMGVIKKISENPATYRITIDKETVYRYAGELMLILIEKVF